VTDSAGSKTSNAGKLTVNAATYTLTVSGGTGDGSYTAGQSVTITANAAPSGKTFDKWTSSYGGSFANANSASTTFTMPSNVVTVTAVYKDLPPSTYTVNVQSDGNGTATANPSSATAGMKITLTAAPNSGYKLKEWQVVSGGVTVSNNQFTMPSSNVTVKAVFEQLPASTNPATTTPPAGSMPTPGGSTPAPGSGTTASDESTTASDESTPAPDDVAPTTNGVTLTPDDEAKLDEDPTMSDDESDTITASLDGENDSFINWLWIVLIALVFVAVGCGIAFIIMNRKEKGLQNSKSKVFCGSCGTRVQAGTKFCPECGANINMSTAQQHNNEEE